MGVVLTPENMPDAVIATLNKLNKNKWIGEMTDLQEYVGFNQIVKNKKEKQNSGRGITLRYVMDHNGSAEHVGLFGTTEFNRDDALVEGTVPWTYTDGNMVFDEREPDMNAGAEQIVDVVKMERSRMITSVLELSEVDVLGKPDTSADNDTPFGVEYWIVKNATLGFNGGDPAGFAAGRAGISTDDYDRHANFTGAYTTVDDTVDTGLVAQMEQAADQTRWIAPAPEPGMGRSGYSRGIFCNWSTKYALKNVAKSNNDSLGFDLSTQTPVFRGAAIQYVPYFDAKTDNPLYMIDFNHFYAVFLRNWFMKELKVTQLAHQPHCFGVVTSMVWNIVCDDLRRQAVFYDAS